MPARTLNRERPETLRASETVRANEALRTNQELPTSAALAAAVCGLVAAWLAAGDAGLLGHALRHALTWAALGGAALAGASLAGATRVKVQGLAILVATAAIAILLTASLSVTVNILAVAVFLAGLSYGAAPSSRLTIALAAETVTVLGIFHLARTSIPVVWLAADSTGSLLGNLAGSVTRQPLWTGASFAGLDFLVTVPYLAVMAPLRFGWKPALRPLKRNPLVWGMAAVLAAHATYLLLLSVVASFGGFSSHAPLPSTLGDSPQLHASSLAEWLRYILPWNALLIAMVLHGVVAWGILHAASRDARPVALTMSPPRTADRPNSRRRIASSIWLLIVAALALLVPLVMAPSLQPATLTGKKIVFYEKGFLNWLRPMPGDYGRYSVGMFGMLPVFVESLGARALVSSDLGEEDLRDADALVVIFPNEPWRDGQLERIWKFVREGGSLLVMGEHTAREADGGNRFNELLRPTAMRVRFDSATFAVGGWLQSYEAQWHPTTAGIGDTENDFGVVIGASVELRPPAQPLLVGRWGWSDPGDLAGGPGLMGNGRYDAGEKLGDLVLAAEQPLGKGKILVFGDTSGLSNGINIGCHEFNSRLFAYLARPGGVARPAWQQVLAVGGLSALVVLIAGRPLPRTVAGVALLLSLIVVVGTARSRQSQNVWPHDGERQTYRLAYIDASHLEAYSRESWREDGVMGLCLTLMRNGYQTLALPELSADRLRHAQLLVCVAPARPYGPDECRVLEEFVRGGGVLIYMVGRDRVGPSDRLLAHLGFRVGAAHWQGETPVGGFTPLGYFKTNYRELPEAFVRFHAGWPVVCQQQPSEIISFYPPDQPLIILRPLGQGAVVLVGDTCFAMNKNLELESGQPIEGLRENAEFWEWLLKKLSERPT